MSICSFCIQPKCHRPFENCVAQVVRDCWDAGLKLGHSVRTPQDTLRTAKLDPQFATTLVAARCLWGNKELVEQTLKQYQSRVLRGRRQFFIAASIDERDKERIAQWGHGSAARTGCETFARRVA